MTTHRSVTAFLAYLPAVLTGLLLLDNPLVHGPLAGEVDISWLVPFILSAVLYTGLRHIGERPRTGRVGRPTAPPTTVAS